MRRVLGLAIASLLLLSVIAYSNPIADAQYGQQSTHDEFRVIFHEPDDDELREYYEWIKSVGGYEKDAKIFSNLFKFPASASTKTITIHFQDCNGSSNAFYSSSHNAVAICYELVKGILSAYNTIDNFEPTIKPGKATLNTIRGILYHELGHALIDVFDLDVLGQEEDAVDGFATILLIQFKEYQTIIDAAILGYYVGIYQVLNLQFNFWNEHSFTSERVHNVVCLLYGSDTKQFASLKGSYLLPEQRAIRCPDEYKQAKKSWENQLAPFIDKAEGQGSTQSNEQEERLKQECKDLGIPDYACTEQTVAAKKQLEKATKKDPLIVKTDMASYSGDASIVVSGMVPVFVENEKVTINLYNPNNVLVSSQHTPAFENRQYLTIVTLGGAYGVDSSLLIAGVYTIHAFYSSSSAQTTFTYKSATTQAVTKQPSPSPTPAPERTPSVSVFGKQVKDLLLIRVKGYGIDQFDIMNYSSAPFIDACRAKDWDVISCDPNIAKFTSFSTLDGKAIFKIKLRNDVNSFNWFAYTDGEKIDSGSTSIIRR